MWSIPPNPTHVERTKDQAPESCIPTREWQIQQVRTIKTLIVNYFISIFFTMVQTQFQCENPR